MIFVLYCGVLNHASPAENTQRTNITRPSIGADSMGTIAPTAKAPHRNFVVNF